jgi:hypothetical protein
VVLAFSHFSRLGISAGFNDCYAHGCNAAGNIKEVIRGLQQYEIRGTPKLCTEKYARPKINNKLVLIYFAT